MDKWTKIKSKKTHQVSFALGIATVKLLSFFNYKNGRVYHVQDIDTGRCDFVGAEFIV